jgi:hypothetical protein
VLGQYVPKVGKELFMQTGFAAVDTLQVLLDRYGAMHLAHAEAQTDALTAAVNRLLHGSQ